MVRVGLTGGIAAGKSTISTHCRQRGIRVIDYDQLARDVTEPGSAGLSALIGLFGNDILLPDGSLNREWMAEHVFAGDHAQENRHKLESVIHPLIFQRARMLDRQWSSSSPQQSIIIHDIPLLVESLSELKKYNIAPDYVITVEADDQTRINRMVQTRGMSRRQAEERIQAQLPQKVRRECADYCISSDQPLDRMVADCDRILDSIRGRQGKCSVRE